MKAFATRYAARFRNSRSIDRRAAHAAQCVSLNTLASAYNQNFDALANTGTTNELPPAVPGTLVGWDLTETGGGARDNEQYAADNGASTTGDTESFGATAATERALGSLRSGTLIPVYGACFTNNTGGTITSLDIGYTGEEWRLGTAARTDSLTFEHSTDATSLVTGTWTGVAALTFTTPVTTTTGAKDGNVAANRTVIAPVNVPGFNIANGASFWIRWNDTDASGADDGLAVDDFSLTPQGGAANAAVVPTCPSPLTTTTGSATSVGVSATDADGTVTSATITGITPSDPGTITLTGFTPAGSVGGTANATLSVSAATPAGTYSVTIQWANNDGTPQTANCVVSVVVSAPPSIVFIHDVQGSGATTPIPGSSVTVEGVVTGDFQPIPNDNRLSGFFLQEENADFDANPATSEGIFVFCSACPTNVAEGQRVQVTGTVSEFNGLTEITATTAGSVVITNAGNNLAQISPATIDLPVVGVINDYYEARENMLVTYSDTLTVSEYFEQARYGRIELYEGGRPRQFAEDSSPSTPGYVAHLEGLDRRRVYLDDDDNVENSVLNLPDGSQFVYHPRANGGLSIGTQGTDFFRGGDLVTGLTGILHYSFSGGTSPDEWRIRPAAATPAAFTVANSRPATPPAVGGAIRGASVNVLNYFITLNMRGADSAAELNRQRERISIVLCGLNPDVAGLMEIENGTAAITDLLGAVNARCGGAHPYAFVNTGGSLGTDEIRVMLIYRTGVLSPVGSPLVDLNAVHNRPPTAQTFDVVDATNPAFGQRFTALANHSKSKGCSGASGADLDQNDGQACFSATRLAQANRIVTWVSGTVIPAAGDPDVLLLGDFNAYPKETSAARAHLGRLQRSRDRLPRRGRLLLRLRRPDRPHRLRLVERQLHSADHRRHSVAHQRGREPALRLQRRDQRWRRGIGVRREAGRFCARSTARLFQAATPYRASDHDPILLGIFQVADLAITKTDSPDPVTAGSNITYTITVTNNGPDAAATSSWSDTLPAGTTFVSLPAVAGWSCTTPAVGSGGTVSCTNTNFAVGSAAFTLTVAVAPSTAAGTVLSNTATVTSSASDGTPGNNSATATTTVAGSADLSVTKVDTPDPVDAGANISYTITVNNAGPGNASTVSLSDTLPAGTTFVSLSSPGGWSCTTPAVGAGGTVSCSIASFSAGSSAFTLVVAVAPSVAAGTVITNSATISSATSDPNSGNETGTATTTVAASADLSVTKVDTPDPVNAGSNITYTITVNNAGPSNAATVSLSDTLPAGTTFVSLSSPGGWSCTTPAVGATGTVSCSIASFSAGSSAFTLVVAVAAVGRHRHRDLQHGHRHCGHVRSELRQRKRHRHHHRGRFCRSLRDEGRHARSGRLRHQPHLHHHRQQCRPEQRLDRQPFRHAAFRHHVRLALLAGRLVLHHAGSRRDRHGLLLDRQLLRRQLRLHAGRCGRCGSAGRTVITNTATVSSTTSDPNTGNESGTATTTVGGGTADLSITKVDTPDPVSAGTNLTYTITVNNAGPSNATTAALSDTLPANTTFVSLSSPGGWSCTTPAVGAAGTISCANPSMASGSAAFTLTVAVSSLTPAGAVINNTASISAATSDPSLANNSATTTTNVLSPATVTGTKTASGSSFAPGSTITYSIVLSNAGPAAQSNNPGDELVDVLPSQLTLLSATASSGTAVANTGTNTVTWNGSIPAAGSVTITIQALIEANVPVGTSITNQATFYYDADGNGHQ